MNIYPSTASLSTVPALWLGLLVVMVCHLPSESCASEDRHDQPRACLINRCIATTHGTHSMRSLFPIPAEMKRFPVRLRELGYYTFIRFSTSGNLNRLP